MSSPATTAFLEAWRKHNATRVCLLKIVLSAPSALTLRFGTTETHTPDGNSWEAGLTHDSIRSRVGYMETGVILTETNNAMTLSGAVTITVHAMRAERCGEEAEEPGPSKQRIEIGLVAVLLICRPRYRDRNLVVFDLNRLICCSK